MTDSNGNPQVSIFCLTYNHVKYIRDCIDGILSQKTSFDFEVIVHDDASTDGTSDILRDFARKDSRVVLYVEEENQYNNSNLDYLRDIFMPMARGRYIAFCEGDDCWINPNKLQDQFDYMESHSECFMCSHLAQLVDGTTEEPIGFFGYGDHDRLLYVDDLLKDWRIPTASTFMRKKDLDHYLREWTFQKPVGDFPRAIYFASRGSIFYSGKMYSRYRYSVPGSWTTVVNNNPQKRLAASIDWLHMLEAIDQELNFEHHDAIVHRSREYARHVCQLGQNPADICSIAKEAAETFSAMDLIKISLKKMLFKMGFQLISIGPAGSLGWRLSRIRK